MQTIVPMLSYEDGIAAMDWLCMAFGFEERMRLVDNQGRLGHGELVLGESVVMLAAPAGYTSPLRHRRACSIEMQAYDNPWAIDGVLVMVDDVAKYYERAKSAGAGIVRELEKTEHGTVFTAEDLEGHRWMFNQA